jgi:uncharacterized membrane protein YpjA
MRAMGCINGFFYCANSIAITAVPFKPGFPDSQTSLLTGRVAALIAFFALSKKPATQSAR